ncbi:MAG: LamG domain-containing protein, partial [Planctomycetes bacterium]|nr:LamG domain-containing protein [Planctomycetota bacterium]
KAIAFFDDGKNVQIHDPADPEYFNFYTMGMTVSCWIKTDVANGGATMVSKQRPNAFDGWVLQNPDNPQFTIQRMTDETVAGSDSLTDGQWHMVTGRFDGTSIRLYVDATLVDVSEDNVETLLVPGDALVIGANNPDGGGSFDGMIDDVRIWNYAIDPIEIAQLYTTLTGESACTEVPPYDLDGNCVVDLNDIALFVGQWPVSNWVHPD